MADRGQQPDAGGGSVFEPPASGSPLSTFREAFAAFPVPLATIRRSDGRILYTNRHLDHLYGVAPESLWNQDEFRLFPRLKDRRRLHEGLKRDGRVQKQAVRGQRQDGTPLRLDVWQTPFVCSASVECVLTVLCDVTQHHRKAKDAREQAAALSTLLGISERERRFLSFEIHDGILQDLTGALMHLQALRRTLEKNRRPRAATLDEPLQAVERLLREGIAEGRRLIERSRVPELDEVGLVGALETLVARVADTSGIAIDFQAQVPPDILPAAAEDALYRITQESLNNVWQHSRSERARVELRVVDDELELSIKDWGVGFDAQNADFGEEHLGLAGLRLRARLVGGTAAVESQPTRGTTVRVRVPLPAGSEQILQQD